MVDLISENSAESAVLQDVLLECLSFVEQQGWNALKPSFLTSRGTLGQFFPQGIEQVILYHQHLLNQKMIDSLDTSNGTTAKIIQGIQQRLLANTVPLVKQTHRFFLHPFQLNLAKKCLYDLVNTLWYAAGDMATDFNFYTKRAILAGVFTATELYWLGDTSPGYYKTWDFLDKALLKVYQFSKLKKIFSFDRLFRFR